MVALANVGAAPNQVAAPAAGDDATLLYRLADQIRRESGCALPFSYFLAQAKARLAANPDLARVYDTSHATSRGLETSACFEAWARIE